MGTCTSERPSCASAKPDDRSPIDQAPGSIRLPVGGMSCASCVGHVERAIRARPGVDDVAVNLATHTAQVSFVDGSRDVAAVVEAIRAAGYEVPTRSAALAVSGMSCASCVGHVERALRDVPAVVEASVNLASERATVQVIESAVTDAELVAALRQAGYEAEPIRPHDAGDSVGDDRGDARKDQELRDLKRSVLLAAALTLPVFVLDMGGHMIPAFHHAVVGALGKATLALLLFALATAVQFGPGLRFYRRGLPALLRARPDMNALVMLGTSAAWGYSTIATFFPSLLPAEAAHVYFEASTVIITLVLAGRYLEARAKGRTGDAIKKLLSLEARTARVVRNGSEVELGLDEVRVGDVVRVRPGEKVPVDGEVIEGESFVDESMITGEPIPARKAYGAEVIGGTINKAGSFALRATRVGADTLLAQIVRMVEEAQSAKLPIQAVVDRVTHVFVPIVLGVAAATFALWMVFGPAPALTFALVNAVAVLIIACPCAMGLATPTSIMVGTGRAAEMGVLFRKGDALQSLRDAEVIGLDKTGTLTLGRPALTAVRTREGFEEDEVLRLAASLEQRSEHPLAAALVEAARTRGLNLAQPERFEAKPGLGVAGAIEGREVTIGADRMVHGLGIVTDELALAAEDLARDGKTPVYAVIDGELAAVLAIADPIKDSTPAAIEALHARGLRVAMITGDNQRTAEAIARRLGIDDVVAEVLPDGKVEAIAELQRGGRKVAFVGDGINDAPALAQADVGLAIGTGTDIAIESADVVLMSGDLRNVPNAIALSQATITNIHQNLFWAFAYNAALIPVAAGALYPFVGVLLSPVFAAGAMAASSVCVVSNALRLRRFRPPLAAAAVTAPSAGEAADSLDPNVAGIEPAKS
jgi:P-type Cu+ transporter